MRVLYKQEVNNTQYCADHDGDLGNLGQRPASAGYSKGRSVDSVYENDDSRSPLGIYHHAGTVQTSEAIFWKSRCGRDVVVT